MAHIKLTWKEFCEAALANLGDNIANSDGDSVIDEEQIPRLVISSGSAEDDVLYKPDSMYFVYIELS